MGAVLWTTFIMVVVVGVVEVMVLVGEGVRAKWFGSVTATSHLGCWSDMVIP